jgi:hypothetical protein
MDKGRFSLSQHDTLTHCNIKDISHRLIGLSARILHSVGQFRWNLVPILIFQQFRMILVHLVNNQVTHLQVSVNHVVHLKVVIVLTEWIYHRLSNLEPAHVEDELKAAMDRYVVEELNERMLMILICNLIAENCDCKVGVCCNDNDLNVN